jgi:hypothetical protein
MYCASPASRRRDPRAIARPGALLCTWLAVAILAGCSDDPAPGVDAATARAELGTGTLAFERLVDGQPLDLISGPQGGFHFVVHARMRGLTPGDPRQPGLAENPTTYLRVLDENGVRVDVPEVRQLGYTPDPRVSGWYALPSGRILLIDTGVARGLYGQTVTIELQIEDAEGRMAGDSARITAVAFPPDAGPGRPVDAGTAVDAARPVDAASAVDAGVPELAPAASPAP